MDNTEDSPSNLGFSLQFKTEYAEVFISEKDKAILCIATADYVPIKSFRTLFEQIGELVIDDNFSKLIFDKRNLRTFHQPSMEWYFLEWKLAMMEKGLWKHRKLLPNLDWFKKAVEIARKPLLERFPKNALSKIDIQYCDSIGEALIK